MQLKGLSHNLFMERYAYPGDKDWNDRAHTISHVAASAERDDKKEEWRQQFWNVLENGDFIPGGRIIFGAGRPKFNLLNCYVLWPEDHVESIGQVVKDSYLISCGGGGIGYDFSRIRPRGDDIQTIKNSAPGAVSNMKMINEIGEHVRSGKNRRTALMGILRVDHPDLFEFLVAKLDKEALNNFNISVGITDEFIEAVHKDKEWHFTFNGRRYDMYKVTGRDTPSGGPGTSVSVLVAALSEEDAMGRANVQLKPTYTTTFKKATKVKNMARGIWDRLFKSAVECGDPGIYNVDFANRYTNVSYFEFLPATNPCQPAFAKVLTKEGTRELGEVNIGDQIWSKEEWTTIIKKWSTGVKSVYSYKTTGGEFIGTSNHRLDTREGKTEAQYAENVLTIAGECPQETRIVPGVVMDGLFFGDGYIKKQSGRSYRYNYLIIGKNDQDYFDSEVKKFIGNKAQNRGSDCADYVVDTSITEEEKPRVYQLSIPKRFFANNNELASFLRGLYTANGSIVQATGQNSFRITYKTASQQLALDVQLALSSLGIRSYITTNKSKNVKFSNGTYTCKESYDVNITSDRVKFLDHIGFIQKYKMTKARHLLTLSEPNLDKDLYTSIKETEYLGEFEVFDLTVDNHSHTYWTGGLSVSNCGEIPIPAYGNCCLGHINLNNMVDWNGRVQWKKMARTIRAAVRFLDNILTINHFAVSECREVGHNSRRIGVGVTGLHYFLIKAGYNYGDESCCEFVERLFATIRDEAYKASIELAKEKGAFTAFDTDKYLEEEFAKTLPPRIRREIKKHGIRNAVMLTCAPCGTNSMILGVSTGIEPMFSPVYERSYRDNNVWKKQLVVDPLFRQLYEKKDPRIVHCLGAFDITPEEHIRIQASIQKYVDQSLSKTCNLPEKAKYEDVKDIILDYASDVKGFTIYRSGSRGLEPLKAISINKMKKPALEKLMQEAVGYGTEESSPSMCDINGKGCE